MPSFTRRPTPPKPIQAVKFTGSNTAEVKALISPRSFTVPVVGWVDGDVAVAVGDYVVTEDINGVLQIRVVKAEDFEREFVQDVP